MLSDYDFNYKQMKPMNKIFKNCPKTFEANFKNKFFHVCFLVLSSLLTWCAIRERSRTLGI